MVWLLSRYVCFECEYEWADEWSCGCDDECPACEARDISPIDSEDLTVIVEEERQCFIVYFSPESAEDDPEYVEVGRFLTEDLARSFASVYQPDQIALCT